MAKELILYFGRILQVLCRGLRLSLDFDFKYLAHHTPGYVGADLMALTREAAMSAVNRSVGTHRALTLSPPRMTEVPHANSLDLDETPNQI